MVKAGKRQVAALPFRIRKGRHEILLVTSRETKRWVIPKGWPMLHLKDYNAARQEALEEAGVEGRVTRKRIGKYTYRKLQSTTGVRTLHVDVFAMEIKNILRAWPEKNERKRQWFPVEEAILAVNEPELRRLIHRFNKARHS